MCEGGRGSFYYLSYYELPAEECNIAPITKI